MTFTVISGNEPLDSFFSTHIQNRPTLELEKLEMLIKIELRERDFAYINELMPHDKGEE